MLLTGEALSEALDEEERLGAAGSSTCWLLLSDGTGYGAGLRFACWGLAVKLSPGLLLPAWDEAARALAAASKGPTEAAGDALRDWRCPKGAVCGLGTGYDPGDGEDEEDGAGLVGVLKGEGTG